MLTGLRPLDALLPRAAVRFGSKAESLAALARAGFPVPAGFALSADLAEETFARVLGPDLRPERLLAGVAPDPDRLAAARERVRSADLAPVLVGHLRRAFEELCTSPGAGVVVRSSALGEDLPTASAAGLHASVLNVCSHQALLDAVRECWASLFHDSVATYLAATGSTRPPSAIGVVVQVLVPAETAGVLFTVNPLTGDADEMVVDAAFGLPIVVTDGRVTPDTYRVDKRSGRLRDRVIGDKRIRVVPRDGGGLLELPVAPEQAGQHALDEQALSRVIELGRRIERHFGGPRDVEFAMVGDTLYVLQARPVTTAASSRRRSAPRPRRRVGADPSETVWSNVNVGEALPGVATPLTWSVLSAFSDTGFRHAFAALGCTVPREATLVGNFRGRIYLNLTELIRIGGQVPGFRPSAVLPLAGAAEIERLERELGGHGFRAVARLPGVVARYGATHLQHRRRLHVVEAELRDEHSRLAGLDLRILPGPSLSETLADTQRLLERLGATMLTTYGGLLSTIVVLQTALRVLVRDDAARVQQRLLSVIEGVESAEPGRDLLDVVAALLRDAPGRAAVEGGARRTDDLPAGLARAALERFLRTHGHRGAREAELSEPRWSEDPALLFDVLRLHLAAPLPDAGGAHSTRIRSLRAERDRALHAVPAPARPALRAFCEVVRRDVRERERLRALVVRVLGLLRRIGLEASRRIRSREPDVGEDAAFLLTLDELHAALGGDLRSIGGLVRARRHQLERDRRLPDPPDTFVGYPSERDAPIADATQLRGIAASPGVSEGRARVLGAAAELAKLAPGEILVAPFADVGWTPAFLGIAGLVTDRGGALSHACIIAREYGLPAVVNVRGATHVVRTGDRLRVDGDAGTVEILEPAARV